jgi:hypothetical protein
MSDKLRANREKNGHYYGSGHGSGMICMFANIKFNNQQQQKRKLKNNNNKNKHKNKHKMNIN